MNSGFQYFSHLLRRLTALEAQRFPQRFPLPCKEFLGMLPSRQHFRFKSQSQLEICTGQHCLSGWLQWFCLMIEIFMFLTVVWSPHSLLQSNLWRLYRIDLLSLAPKALPWQQQLCEPSYSCQNSHPGCQLRIWRCRQQFIGIAATDRTNTSGVPIKPSSFLRTTLSARAWSSCLSQSKLVRQVWVASIQQA